MRDAAKVVVRMDLNEYVFHECDHLTTILHSDGASDAKVAVISAKAEELEMRRIPDSYVVSYLIDGDDGCIIWGGVHGPTRSTPGVEARGESSHLRGKLLFRRHTSHYDPTALDIWLVPEEDVMLVMNTTITKATHAGDFGGRHNYVEATANLEQCEVLQLNRPALCGELCTILKTLNTVASHDALRISTAR